MSLSLKSVNVVDTSYNSLSVWLKNVLDNLKRVQKEAPLCTFKKRLGSYTVEAAVALPLCLFFLVFIMYFFRVLYISWNVNSVLMKTSREYAVVCTGDCDDIQRSAAVSSAVIRLSQVDYLSKEIAGGVFGMDYSETKTEGNYIDLNVSYRLKNPITFFGNKYIRVSGRGCSRKWVGFDPNEDESQDRYVYVTEYGTVYHKSLSCNYLDLSIHAVDKSGISKRRNEGGGRYKSCPLCKGKNASGLVYITDYGDVYHSRLSCSGLKRTIKCLKLSDAKEKYKACSKCAS